jgi:hypothetical protein
MVDNLLPRPAAEFDLGVLAGGDIFEWAAAQVQADYDAARRRLGLTDPVTPPIQTGEPHP